MTGNSPSAASVECAFTAGGGDSEGALTWAQQFMREAVLAAGGPIANFDLLVVHDLGRPLSIPAAVEFIRRFVLRHPVLRTSISMTTPVQQVRAAGTLSIPVVRAEDSVTDLRGAVPGTTAESPFSPLLVVVDHAVVRIALRISHLNTDAGGARLLADDLAALADGRTSGETVTASPLDLARFERSEEGQAVQRQSLEHAATVYDVSPPTMFPRRRIPESPRFWYGQLRSANVLVAIDTLRREWGVTPVGALVGSLAAVVAAQAGSPSALLFLISSNRFDLDWAHYPGLLSQEAILHLPIEATLRATMRAASAKAMRSLPRARYAPAELAETRRAAERRRGVTFDQLGTAVVLNLIPAAPETLPAEPTPTTFGWSGRTDEENLGLFIDASHTAREFVLGARVDTALIAPAETESWLRAMEWAILTAASEDAPVQELHAHLER